MNLAFFSFAVESALVQGVFTSASKGFAALSRASRPRQQMDGVAPPTDSRIGSWLRENVEAKVTVRILFRRQADRTRGLRRNCLALFAVFYSSCRLRP